VASVENALTVAIGPFEARLRQKLARWLGLAPNPRREEHRPEAVVEAEAHRADVAWMPAEGTGPGG
jgi:hypothetical protein